MGSPITTSSTNIGTSPCEIYNEHENGVPNANNPRSSTCIVSERRHAVLAAVHPVQRAGPGAVQEPCAPTGARLTRRGPWPTGTTRQMRSTTSRFGPSITTTWRGSAPATRPSTTTSASAGSTGCRRRSRSGRRSPGITPRKTRSTMGPSKSGNGLLRRRDRPLLTRPGRERRRRRNRIDGRPPRSGRTAALFLRQAQACAADARLDLGAKPQETIFAGDAVAHF